ncbi:MAG: cryptic plasmid protein A [Cupriavidus sp.]|nr:cryptic plasmid protein A [Cupriavidus sp.]
MEDLGVIVENEQDRRTLRWLIDTAGQDAIREAVQRIPGRRKPYVSNVAKALGLTLPKDLEVADRETALRHLEAIRKQLERSSFQTKTD